MDLLHWISRTKFCSESENELQTWTSFIPNICITGCEGGTVYIGGEGDIGADVSRKYSRQIFAGQYLSYFLASTRNEISRT